MLPWLNTTAANGPWPFGTHTSALRSSERPLSFTGKESCLGSAWAAERITPTMAMHKKADNILFIILPFRLSPLMSKKVWGGLRNETRPTKLAVTFFYPDRTSIGSEPHLAHLNTERSSRDRRFQKRIKSK
jgi:hypothetical protein